MDLQGLQQLSTHLKKQASYIDDFLQTQENRGLKLDRKQGQAGTAKTRQPDTILDPEQTIRRDNLARAVQWYTPELIKKRMPHACLAKLERILQFERKKKGLNYNGLSSSEKLERLLFDMKSSDYSTIEQCLHALEGYNPDTLRQVWILFEQHNETNIASILCGYCRIRTHVSLKDFSRYLWRQSIISDNLYEKILESCSDMENQSSLWDELDIEIKHCGASHVMSALSETLKSYTEKYGKFRTEMNDWFQEPKSSFACTCRELKAFLSRPADNLESDMETLTSDCESILFYPKHQRRRTRSTSSTRRKARQSTDVINGQSVVRSQSRQNASSKEIALTQNTPLEALSTSVPGSVMPINVGRKKTTKIFNFHNTNGSVSVGNKFVRVGKKLIPDSSNDTDGNITNISDSEFGRPCSPIRAIENKTLDKTKSKVDSRFSKKQDAEFEMKELNAPVGNKASLSSNQPVKSNQIACQQIICHQETDTLRSIDISETDINVSGFKNATSNDSQAAENLVKPNTIAGSSKVDFDAELSDGSGYETAEDNDQDIDVSAKSCHTTKVASVNILRNGKRPPDIARDSHNNQYCGEDSDKIVLDSVPMSVCDGTHTANDNINDQPSINNDVKNLDSAGIGGDGNNGDSTLIHDTIENVNTMISVDVNGADDAHRVSGAIGKEKSYTSARFSSEKQSYESNESCGKYTQEPIITSSEGEHEPMTGTATSGDEDHGVVKYTRKKSNQLYFDDNHFA